MWWDAHYCCWQAQRAFRGLKVHTASKAAAAAAAAAAEHYIKAPALPDLGGLCSCSPAEHNCWHLTTLLV
jgi:hypothetical protein